MRRKRAKATDRWVSYGVIIFLFLGIYPIKSHAKKPTGWLFLPFNNSGVPDDTAVVFKDLFKHAVCARLGGQAIIMEDMQPCSDSLCAAQKAQAKGADRVIYGNISSLKDKVFIVIYMTDAEGRIIRAERMTGLTVDEFDVIAERLAKALTRGRSLAAGASLGSVTRAEAEPATRRKGDFGFEFALGAFLPTSVGYSDFDALAMVDLGLCYETNHFSLETRGGYRFDTKDEDRHARQAVFGIRGNYIFLTSEISPYIGLGVELHYLDEEILKEKTVGNFIQQTSSYTAREKGFAPGLIIGGGLEFLRTYSARLRLEANYSVTFTTLNDHTNPQALAIGLAVIF